MKRRYYVAYGSNLNVVQMRRRCPNAKIIGTGEIKDYELLFKGSMSGAYLTIEKKKGSIVPVAVWSVTTEDESALDMYEGYPTFYYKKEFELPIKSISSNKVKNKKVFVYIMHEERKVATPSTRYMRTCLCGYKYFHFDERLLFKAYNKSSLEVSYGR